MELLALEEDFNVATFTVIEALAQYFVYGFGSHYFSAVGKAFHGPLGLQHVAITWEPVVILGDFFIVRAAGMYLSALDLFLEEILLLSVFAVPVKGHKGCLFL